MSTWKRSVILRPPVCPPRWSDESLSSYVGRLVDKNRYSTRFWLAPRRDTNCVDLVDTSEMRQKSEISDDLIDCELDALAEKHFYHRPKICPVCVKEHGYWRTRWELKASSCCPVHGQWLVNQCPSCQRDLHFDIKTTTRCECGEPLTMPRADHSPPPDEVLKLQRFLEGEIPNDENFLVLQPSELTLSRRSELVWFFAKWHFAREKSCGRDWDKDSDIQAFISAAEGLMLGKPGFWLFLKRLGGVGSKSEDDEGMLNWFYRKFIDEFPEDNFSVLHRHLIEYLHEYWQQPLNRRNSLFTEDERKNHPWIPITQAKRESGLSKTAILKAVDQGLVRSNVYSAGSRTMTSVYRPDLERRYERILDIIDAKEGACLLGLTKKQFRMLAQNEYFSHAISPYENGHASWQFSRSELRRFGRMFADEVTHIDNDWWELPRVIRFIAPREENPLLKIIEALGLGEIRGVRLSGDIGFAGVRFNPEIIEGWYRSWRTNGRMSIVDVAKRLGINQEFAYQLLNLGYIQHSMEGKLRWISEDDLELFENQYVILSKLAKQTGTSSAALAKHIRQRGVSSCGGSKSHHLRQKLYQRDRLAQIGIIK
ncbi:MAG: TniQ family protein [Pseudomonadales bacterium]|nr:TniQ family protein [Pseudomonadales bacterium]MBO6596622.1 TniQ family protein [Pseudomonadales bacterium]MBO6823389.1 TniQ family protein [Pseudomonadales bacterium]